MIDRNDPDEQPDRVSAPEPAAITVEDCSLSFGELSVLEDVSLTIEPGEFVGFVGPNGAGKTTLLRAISGAIEPDSGRVAIDDVDVHAVDSKTSSRLVSVVPQDTSLSFSFPVRDVVEMGRHPHRSRFAGPTREDRAAVERALERTRTTELADRGIDEVSGGQRQRVVLARAIAQETPALVLDEPTASLDVNHQLETLELVRELVDEGRTVVAAIHDLDLAARYCDRLVMLAEGRIYDRGAPSEVLSGQALADVFDASGTVTRNPVTGTETVTALPTEDATAIESHVAGRAPRVHVLGTGSTAAGAIARLAAADADIELSLGPVTTGDSAAETAADLDVDRIAVPPLESLSPAVQRAFEDRVRDADATVVTADALDAPGAAIRQLLETVDAVGGPIVVAREQWADGSLDESSLEATPETILGSVERALADPDATRWSVADAAGDEFGSRSDGDAGLDLSAESSSD